MPFIRAFLGLNKRREEPRVLALRRPGLLTLRGRPKAEKRNGGGHAGRERVSEGMVH